MRRPLATALIALAVGALGSGRDAAAGISYSLSFRSTDVHGAVITDAIANGNTFAVGSSASAVFCNAFTGVGCPVTDLFLRTTDPLTLHSVSVAWDNSDGLSVVSASEWVGVAVNMMSPPTLYEPLTGFTIGRSLVSSFDGAVPAPNPPPSLRPGTYHIGTIVWDTSAAIPGGGHAIAFHNRLGLDGTISVIGGINTNTTGLETLGTGAIWFLPEPATASLLGLGLLGLALARRRRP